MIPIQAGPVGHNLSMVMHTICSKCRENCFSNAQLFFLQEVNQIRKTFLQRNVNTRSGYNWFKTWQPYRKGFRYFNG